MKIHSIIRKSDFNSSNDARVDYRVFRAGKKGGKFTLIELMVILAVIGIMTSMLMPLLKQAGEQAEQIYCSKNQEQIGTLFHMYATDNNDYFPAPYQNSDGNYWSNVLYSLYVKNDLRYLGQWTKSWDTFDSPRYEDWFQFAGQGSAKETECQPFHCPSQDYAWRRNAWSLYPVSYAMNGYLNAGPATHEAPKLSRIGKLSEKMLVMDGRNSMYVSCPIYWSSSNTINREEKLHGENRNILYVDGHVGLIGSLDIPTSHLDPFWRGE